MLGLILTGVVCFIFGMLFGEFTAICKLKNMGLLDKYFKEDEE